MPSQKAIGIRLYCGN